MTDENGDSPEVLMSLSHHVLFDTGAARSVCPSTFRPDVPVEPSEEVPLHQADGTRVAHYGSKFLKMGVGTQRIEGRFDVRNVTKPIVAAGQVTDAGQGVWLSGDGGYILDVMSAKRVERLLGNRKGFVELRKQRGVYVIPCVGSVVRPLPADREGVGPEEADGHERCWSRGGQACKGKECSNPPE